MSLRTDCFLAVLRDSITKKGARPLLSAAMLLLVSLISFFQIAQFFMVCYSFDEAV